MIKSNKNYVFVALCLAVVLCTAMLLVGLNFNQSVFADFNELDPDSIVNFNQMLSSSANVNYYGLDFAYNNGLVTINGTSSYSSGDPNVYGFLSYPNLILDHKYYLCSNSDNWCILFYGNGTSSTQYAKSIFTPNNNGGVSVALRPIDTFTIANGTSLNISFGLYVIDLTSMFGSNDNIPSLDQCNELFISDSYPYNTGSPVSLSGLNSYAQGFNDAISGFEYRSTNSNFLAAAQSVNINGFYGNVSVSDSILQVEGNRSSATCFYLPFNFIVPVGSTIKFYGRFSQNESHNILPLYVGYYKNNQMIEITHYGISGGSWTPFEIQFNNDVELSGVYIYMYLEDTEFFSCANCSFSVLTLDPYSAVQTAYESGVRNTESYYNSYYGLGGAGYSSIYNAGKTAGINENNPYTFGYLMSSVVEAPLNAVLSIFNFDFLGYNFKNVITLLLTVCIIVAIVRLFVGGAA